MGTGITDVIGEPHDFLPLGPTNFKNSEIGCLITDLVKPKTMKLVFLASPLSMQH
jgi:hypothetical protein